MANVWTEDRIAHFRQMYESGERAEVIMREFALTHSTMLTYARKWSIRRLKRPKRRVLTDEQIRWIKANYPTMTNDFCCRFIGITSVTLRDICKTYDLHKRVGARAANVSDARKSLFSGESRMYNYREAVVIHRYDACLGYRIRLEDGSEYDCTCFCNLKLRVGERVLAIQKKSPKCREFGDKNKNKIQIVKRINER